MFLYISYLPSHKLYFLDETMEFYQLLKIHINLLEIPNKTDDSFSSLQQKILFQIHLITTLIYFLLNKNHILLSSHHIVLARQFVVPHSNKHMS